VIEHDMQVIRALCDRLTVLHHGELLAEGRPADVLADRAVQAAYLGRAA
jgi:branched-chain amino acid transport system ATP-binding protein